MLVLPWPLREVIDVMPEIVANCFSSGVATDEAIVSGLAPGADVLVLGARAGEVRRIVIDANEGMYAMARVDGAPEPALAEAEAIAVGDEA